MCLQEKKTMFFSSRIFSWNVKTSSLVSVMPYDVVKQLVVSEDAIYPHHGAFEQLGGEQGWKGGWECSE